VTAHPVLAALVGPGPHYCTNCHAPIKWARTGSGRPVRVNATPDPAGNVELVDGVAKHWGSAHHWPAGTDRWMPHSLTCLAEPGRPR
jgi:hypothetical protein